MDTVWTSLRSTSTLDVLGHVRFRSNGEKLQRRVVTFMNQNIGSVPVNEHFDRIKELSEGLEDVTLEYFNDYDCSRTLLAGWSDDLDGYTMDDLTPAHL